MFSLFDEEGIWDASIVRAYKDAYEIATENEDGSELGFSRKEHTTHYV